MIAGLLIGSFVSFLMYLKIGGQGAGSEPSATVSMSVPEQRAPQPPAPKAEPIPPPPKPRFEFYRVLPRMEVVVPEAEIKGRPKQGVKQVEEPGTYLLQAGSFRSFEQADRLKAQLALLGLETTIQSAAINAQETWHRVRVGPFHDLDDLHEVRVQLKEHGIDAILIRVKG
jgi:cell division protein FtsN